LKGAIMPIKGLSNRGLALPEIGQIRKGSKKRKNQQGKEIFGEELTYFRVEFAEGEEKAAAKFLSVYGDKPNAIRVLLPFNEIERTWDPWKEAYTAGRLVARSDGEFVVYMLDNRGDVVVQNWLDKSGNKVPHPSNNIAGYDFQNKPVEFKNTGRLKVIVPDLERAAYLTVMTSSTHDIGNISDQLAAFKELNGGQIAGIPFILRRRPAMISTPSKDGPRVRRKKYLISVEVDANWAKAKFGQLNHLALPNFTGDVNFAGELPSGEVEIDVDDDEIVEEGQPTEERQEQPQEHPAEPVDLKKRHAELWREATKAGLLDKDSVPAWSIKANDTDEAIAAKIALIQGALA
jgi:hypothetical protein